MKDYIGQLGISAALLGVLIEAETISGLIPRYCKPGKILLAVRQYAVYVNELLLFKL